MSATAASGRAERAARGAALLACTLALAACVAEDAPPPAAVAEEGAAPAGAAEAVGLPPAGAATDGGTRRPPAAVAPARPEDAAMAALAPDAGEREAPPGEEAPPDLMGLDAAALRALMGRPDFAWEQPGAAMWRYDGARCALFAFLQDGRVGHVEIHGDDAAWRAACLRRLLAQRP